MKSAIYQGQVRHRRMTPVEHAFSFRMFMMFLDLSELPQLFDRRWFWSDRAPALARFRQSIMINISIKLRWTGIDID